MKAILEHIKRASQILGQSDTRTRNGALANLANALESNRKQIKAANAKDIQAARESGLKQSLIDRLVLDDKAIDSMIRAVEEIRAQSEVLGAVTGGGVRPSGITITQIRVSLGVVLIIYESRPNVTIDTAALCLKSGNAVILKGGKEARFSNAALMACIHQALESSTLPKECAYEINSLSREQIATLLQERGYIDVVIPRGGSALIDFVVCHSKIPVIFHDKGVCHAYIDESADVECAVRVCVNAKVSRPSACNAIETILIHKSCLESILPCLAKALWDSGVEVRADSICYGLLEPKSHRVAKEPKIDSGDFKGLDVVLSNPGLLVQGSKEDYGVEFGAKILALKCVESMDEAIAHITHHGSKHSEIIITQSLEASRRFCALVDASAVFVNASSRFNDGGEFGLGAEMGISTQKLHVRGPMGAIHLTTTKYIVHGECSDDCKGTIRE